MKNIYQKKGFTLIEALISILIVSMLIVSIVSIFSYTIRVVAENKLLVQAITLGEEKMEIIKNLPYSLVGTVNGIPSGSLPQNETVSVNGAQYLVNTFITYVDDPADGTVGGSPADLFGTDYKKVRLQISWNGPTGNKSQVFITNIAPRRNQNIAGTGTLSILVFNANGEPIPQADVHIRATFATSTVDITSQTNNQGRIIIPGSPAGLNKYSIVATKTGYSADRTCAIDASGSTCSDTQGNPNPTKPYASVIEGDYTEVSFAIDLVSQMNITTLQQSVPAEWIINTDVSTYDQDNPSTARCANGNSLYAWRDYRQNNNPRIYAQMYNQAHIAQWNPDLAITTSNNQNNPDIAIDAECKLYVVWNDDRNGNQDIYFNKYNATGTEMWSGAKKVETAANSADQTFPQIIMNASSTFAYIVWLDNRNDANDIYAQKFDTNGNPLWASEIRINSDATTAAQNIPKIQIDKMRIDGKENIYFVWYDNRNNNNDIFAQKLDQDGVKLWTNDVMMNTNTSTSDQINPDFIMSRNGYLYIVWQDNRLGNYDIYAEKYNTAGSSAWTNDIKINSDTGTAPQERPAITEDNAGNFYIVWDDARNGTIDIYMQKIDENGTKLISFDVPVNGVQPGVQENPDIFINASGNPVITWQDNNSGNFDIKSAEYVSDPQTITYIANVPLNIKSAKRIGENPVVYKFNNNYTTDSGGHLSLSNIEWGQYTATSTSYSIIRSDPAQPIIVNPNQTINVILNLQGGSGYSQP